MIASFLALYIHYNTTFWSIDALIYTTTIICMLSWCRYNAFPIFLRFKGRSLAVRIKLVGTVYPHPSMCVYTVDQSRCCFQYCLLTLIAFSLQNYSLKFSAIL